MILLLLFTDTVCIAKLVATQKASVGMYYTYVLIIPTILLFVFFLAFVALRCLLLPCVAYCCLVLLTVALRCLLLPCVDYCCLVLIIVALRCLLLPCVDYCCLVLLIPYSLKFSRLKNFAVFAGCTLTTKIYHAKYLVLVYVYVSMRYNLWAWPFVRARQTIAASAQRIESCWF